MPHDSLVATLLLGLARCFPLVLLLFDEMIPCIISIQLAEKHFGVTLKIFDLHQVHHGDAFHDETQVAH